MVGMQSFNNLRRNFRQRFDACISGNIQPFDLKLQTLVYPDFKDRRCSFCRWGCRIGAVLFRHLARRATKVVSWLSVFLHG